jgi:hypothetical protein
LSGIDPTASLFDHAGAVVVEVFADKSSAGSPLVWRLRPAVRVERGESSLSKRAHTRTRTHTHIPVVACGLRRLTLPRGVAASLQAAVCSHWCRAPAAGCTPKSSSARQRGGTRRRCCSCASTTWLVPLSWRSRGSSCTSLARGTQVRPA